MSVEFILKRHLDEIIQNAYYNESINELKRYKCYKITICRKKVKSYSGTYIFKNKEIRLYDLNADPANNIKTLLHELAHHIDYCRNGQSGHQQPFYTEYRKLIYSALDLGKIRKEDFRNMSHRNTDHNKVKKILNEYHYRAPMIDINKSLYTIKVLNAFVLKEKLKSRLYRWNSVSKTWDKDALTSKELEEEKKYLEEIGIMDSNIEIINSNVIDLESSQYKTAKEYIGYIYISGKTYEARDFLKRAGFHWSKEKKLWQKGIRDSAIIKEISAEAEKYNKLKLEYKAK